MDTIQNINHFNELYDKIKNKTTKEKGDIFELITKYIFLVHPSFCINTKNIWLYNDIPFDIQQKFKLPPKDKGIDLLLETNDEQIYAIQCKYRSDVKNSVNWTELATFTGQLFVNNIDKAIFVTNTYDIDKEIHKCDKIECIYGDFFKELDENFFDNIRNYQSNKKIKYKTKKLYNYQEEAVNKTIEHFKLNDRGYLSMACGTGKTKTTQSIDKIMKNKLTLILVPSLYLLSQIYKEWTIENFGEKIKYILVGSDLEEDDNCEKIPFLSTNEKEIKKQLKNIKDKTIIISTYQSCEKLKKSMKNKEIDLIIFDEAHRTVGDNNKYSYAIFDYNIEAKKRLFVTATPKIYTKISDKDSDSENDNQIISMDNEHLYGKKIFEYQIGQAIDDKRLTQYEIHMLYITDDQIKQYIGKNVTVDNTTYNFHYVATAMLIEKMFKNKQINHLFTYHASVKNSKNFANLLDDITENIDINHIDGEMNAKKKKNIISNFEEKEKAILTSVRVLNEGVNIPIADSTCFVEGRNNSIDIIQCIGRAIRLYNGKETAKIIIPILEEDIINSNFDNLIKIIKNLGDYDYHIKENIMDKKDGIKKLIKIGKYSETNITEDIKLDLKNLEDKISGIIIDKCYHWKKTIDELANFICKYEKRPQVRSENKDEKYLAKWLSHQLDNNNKNLFSEERQQIWDGFVIKYKKYLYTLDEIWLNKYNDFAKFIETNKRRPSNSSKIIEERTLAIWYGHQSDENVKQDETRIQLLNELNDKYREYLMDGDEIWEKMYDDSFEFVKNNKRRPNKESEDIQEKKLGIWVCSQKKNYSKEIEAMKDPEKRKLWDEFIKTYKEHFYEKDEIWHIMFDELVIFVKSKQKKPISVSQDITEKKLAIWFMRQRINYEKNKESMKDDNKCELFGEFMRKYKDYFLDFNELWFKTCEELCEYLDNKKKKPMKTSQDNLEKRLGNWIDTQKKNYPKNKEAMKDEIKKELWDYLCDKYKEYL